MKIGVLSFFYKNYNYGGQLQAYALTKTLNRLLNGRGSAEQICYDSSVKGFDAFPIITNREWFKKATLKEKIKFLIKYFKRKLSKKPKNINREKEIKVRNACFDQFSKKHVPHSKKVFGYTSAVDSNELYDGFIVGSDQVWNSDFYNEGYFLSFAEDSKYKASYAASISKSELKEIEKETFRKFLNRFDKISLRENNISILKDIVDKPVQWVLDPTLLLDRDAWDEVCSPRLIGDKYLFCYFLGGSKKQRELAKKYAKQHDLKIVTLPYLHETVQEENEKFGDILLYEISPGDFISLIKNSEYVFTDSFHASVFSLIYKKQFVVFSRNEFSQMRTRIDTLLNIFENGERFCNTHKQCKIKYINRLKDIDYTKDFSEYEKLKEHSIDFLKTIIEEIEKK